MLCKSEDRDPGHCLKEGRRVTRCATDLCVPRPCILSPPLTSRACSISKMRENCLQQFDEHWGCLEKNNQACGLCPPVSHVF